ncbi:hypothetical protein ACFSR9_14840 [Deinococcus taklimakanensis]|uniref:Uncharacterized protein n=1 Tax=Deinococcus taklimakanensis TaxID=536443 RepID=A0ABW5P5W8_9DEIO
MTNDKKTPRLPLIAFAALPLTVGLAFAAGNTTGTSTGNATAQVQSAQTGQANQAQPRTQTGTNYTDVFLQKLAAGLGISVERLKAAAVTAGTATIDQGVKAGDFPSDRAAEMKTRLQTNPFQFAGGHGRGGFGGRGGDRHGGMRGDHDGHHTQGQQGSAAPQDQGSAAPQDQGSVSGTGQS